MANNKFTSQCIEYSRRNTFVVNALIQWKCITRDKIITKVRVFFVVCCVLRFHHIDLQFNFQMTCNFYFCCSFRFSRFCTWILMGFRLFSISFLSLGKQSLILNADIEKKIQANCIRYRCGFILRRSQIKS